MSPWGASRAATALRFARAVLAAGHELPAVYFRGDGVYHVLPGRQADPGAEDLHQAWTGLAAESHVDLWLCSAACARRLPPPEAGVTAPQWRETGLATWLECLAGADRVVAF